MDKTPIQASLAYWKKLQKHAITPELRASAGVFIQHLESLIQNEKEFAEKCFDAGIDFSEGVDQPNKTVFINQLYPEK